MDQQTAISIALVGAGGAIIGAFVGALGAWIVERSRRGQADRHRFAGDRRALYARFLREANAIDFAVGEYVFHLQTSGAVGAAAVRSRIPDTEPLTQAYEEIRLLGGDRVVTAAGDLIFAAIGVHKQTLHDFDAELPEIAPPTEEYDRDHKRYNLAMRRFEDLARAELAVETGGPIGRLRRWIVSRWDHWRRERAGL